LWGPILVLHELQQIPVAVFSHTAYCVLPGRENSAPGISIPPPRTAIGRAAVRLLAKVMNRAAGVNRDADRIRAAHGLPPLQVTVTEFTGKMPLYLVPSAPELDYNRRDLAPHVHYVGVCASAGAPAGQPAPAAPILVLEEAHYPEDPWLLRTAASALAGISDPVILMAGEGRDLARLDLGKLAPNVQVVPAAPLEAALRSARVVIAHGNSETVLAALAQGVPVVILPRILEQPQIAWRLAASGAGVRLPIKDCTPDRLRAAAQQVLGTPSFRENAQRIKGALERCGGAARAAELAEGLAVPLPTQKA